MPVFNIPRLKTYLDLGLNVIMSGHGGVGKTAVIGEVFSSLLPPAEREKIKDIRDIFKGNKLKYFSAPTMDPWVDLVGVPRAVDDKERGGQVLELVRPEFIKADEVEAIFIDELNRATPKVMNALMELIQFRSINGFKLTKLKVIWAAINPDNGEGEYDVVRLDRALQDRFHVQLEIPYELDEDYLKGIFPDFAPALITWWNDLSVDVKQKVSPRRVEYVGRAIENDLHLADFLPPNANITKLRAAIRSVPFAEQLKEITTEAAAKKFLTNINSATKLLQLVTRKNTEAVEFFNKFKKVMPQELVDAMAPAVAVAGNKQVRITTLSELLPQIDTTGKIGEVELTHLFNEPEFVYSSGSLSEDVNRQIRIGSKSFGKLVSHIIQVFSKAPKPTLSKAMIKDDGTKTNLTKIAMYIAVHDTSFMHFSKADRKNINAHTYLHGTAASKWM